VLVRLVSLYIGLMPLSGNATELTQPPPVPRWLALDYGVSSGTQYTRPYWGLSLTAEVQNVMYGLRIREAENTGYFFPCSAADLSVCRRNLGFSDLSFVLGRNWHHPSWVWMVAGGAGVVMGNRKKDISVEQVITGGLNIESQLWLTLFNRVGLGLSAAGVLTQFGSYVGAGVSLGYGRFHATPSPVEGSTALR